MLSGNTSMSGAGGIANGGGATANISNTTISGNVNSGFQGGGIINDGTLTLSNSTVAGNSADGRGGGIHEGSLGSLNVINTIIANNAGGNCSIFSGSFVSLGHNLSNDTSCPLSASGDLVNTDPQLGPLQDNGGPTLTHALQPGSPAIDAIPVGACTDKYGNPITTDQRGVVRPQGSACDIGAFETESATVATPIPIPNLSLWGVVAMAGLMATTLLWQRRDQNPGDGVTT
jgi:hypothetical protein